MLQYAQYPSTRRENVVISFNLGSLSVGLCNYAVWGLNGLKHQKKEPAVACEQQGTGAPDMSEFKTRLLKNGRAP